MPSGCVYGWKADELGWPTTMKSRYVSKRDMQRAHVDFRELYSPTVTVSGVRMLTAFAYEKILALCLFDMIEQAFVRL